MVYAIERGGKSACPVSSELVETIPSGSILIIPGVGNIKNLCETLGEQSAVTFREMLNDQRLKLIGVCLGFQYLCNFSEEDMNSRCAGVFNLNVESIFSTARPSVGWKKIYKSDAHDQKSSITNLLDNHQFYFTHSFGVMKTYDLKRVDELFFYDLDSSARVLAAVIRRDSIGFQFHPEKSGSAGIALLSAAIDYLGDLNAK
jgi:glutamine amidotransferase